MINGCIFDLPFAQVVACNNFRHLAPFTCVRMVRQGKNRVHQGLRPQNGPIVSTPFRKMENEIGTSCDVVLDLLLRRGIKNSSLTDAKIRSYVGRNKEEIGN